jgi:hypothetical protein
MPVLFVLSALLSGTGAYLLVEAAAGRPPGPPVVAAVLALVVVSFVAWDRYLVGSAEPAFLQAVATLRQGRSALVIDGGGYGLPFLLGLLALAAPAAAGPLLALAGALLVVGQVYAKGRLIRAAGQLRPITLALTVSPRRPS